MAAGQHGAQAHPDIVELQGDIKLLNQRLDSSIQALTASVSALGAEVHLVRGLQEAGQALLMEKMQEVGSTSLHLRLLTESIREHNALEKARQENTEAKLTDLRDKEAHARGERRGAAFVLTLLIALVGYIYVAGVDRQEKVNDALQAQVSENKGKLVEQGTRIQTIEKKLGP